MPYIEQRELTAAQWTSLNPILLKGEVGWESGATPKAKKGDGTTAWNSLPYAVQPIPSLTPYAPLASPAFTGNPTAPTPAPGDNDTSIATTAFVQAVAVALIAGSPTLLNTLKELADAIGDDPNFAATMATALGLKAPLASPVFTGDPQAPTPATGDSDTSIATTAFVKAQLYATLASPTFSGDPKAPTASFGDNDTSIASTAFVQAALAGKIKSGIYTTPVGGVGTGTTFTTANIAHGLAGTPNIITNITTVGASFPIFAQPIVSSVDATNFQLTIQRTDGAALASHVRSWMWMATLL